MYPEKLQASESMASRHGQLHKSPCAIYRRWLPETLTVVGKIPECPVKGFTAVSPLNEQSDKDALTMAHMGVSCVKVDQRAGWLSLAFHFNQL